MEGEGSVGGIEPQYVCVHVPEFRAQARLRLRPNQARLPVAILEGEPPLQQVCSATRKARRLGVADHMMRSQIEAFPGLTLLPRSVAEERSARAALLGAAAAFTPRSEIMLSANSLTCVLDMTGTGLIFGKAKDSALAIAKAISKLGLAARYAVSRNFYAAVCAAPHAGSEPSILMPGREHVHLGALPVSSLPLTEDQAEIFAMWGVRTLAELARLPEVELVERLGQAGKKLHELALGRHPHLMVPEEETFTLEEFVEFETPEERLEALLFVAGPMIDQLIARAQMKALSLASLTITLLLDGGGEHVRKLKPALPLSDRIILLKLMNLDLMAHPPSAAIMGIRLEAEPGKRGNVQTGLFSPQLPEPTRLDITLAQIEAMVGDGRVGSPHLLDTHRPDSFKVERFATPTKAPALVRQQLSAALRRVRPPIALRVLSAMNSDHPATFFFESKRYEVAHAYGPWRQSGEWWSDRLWACEEWDVRATCGESVLLCVLSHDLLQKFWQLEAFYD